MADSGDGEPSADGGARDATSGDASSDSADVESEPTCDWSKKPDENPCVIDERIGVFVSPRGSDDASGTKAAPFKTLGKALAVATSKMLRVYACDDSTGYTEPIALSSTNDRIEMFGGFDCADWSYTAGKRALVRSPSSPALKIDAVASDATIVDFEFDAPDATSAGGSSIGAIINSSTGVVLDRVKLVAARAKDGADGTSMSGTAMSGAPGNAGYDACTANPNPGGPTSISICDGTPVSTGGAGGNGGTSIAAGGNGADGTPSLTSGKAGAGEPTSGAWSCGTGAGQAGDNGADGMPGDGAIGPGALTSAGWIGNRGGDGQPGQPGQGGGGGGGARAPATCLANDAGITLSAPTGASGGSGGGGGCGGKGGQGGGAGGSSIALVSLASSVTLTSCELVAASAGNGGRGANGQPGGSGGKAGTAGTGVNGSKDACPGGIGGQGGNGGPGGGGAGGHSLGVAYTGTALAALATSSIMHAAAGAGGAPGSGGVASGKGADGLGADTLSF